MKIPVSNVVKAVALAVAMLAGVEGVRYQSYQDTGGVWTLCYGYTHGVTKGMTADKEQCWSMLQEEATATATAIAPYLPANLNPNQFAALISFCYNVGTYACKNSTLFALINKGDYKGAAKQFGKWVYVKKLDCRNKLNNCFGIVTRRTMEAALFEKRYD